MMILLIGTKDSKRVQYFKKAANDLDIPIRFVDWEAVYRGLAGEDVGRAVIKLEPPSYSTAAFSEMQEQLRKYQETLMQMAQIPQMPLIRTTQMPRAPLMRTARMPREAGAVHPGGESPAPFFLNTPERILDILDKRKTKQILGAAGVRVTPVFMEHIRSAEQLYARMEAERVAAVFVKPVWFSGAAGTVALRRQPAGGRTVAYTSCRIEGGRLFNTKTLRTIRDEREITELIDALVPMDVMAERWIPKDSVDGKSYDLRVVWQFGKRKQIVVRQSEGPVTNLHLNNRAASLESIALTEENLREVDALCRDTMEALPGLLVAGIDVLLAKGSRKPYIIEVNGQGDLLYQDIYGENAIYKEQAEWMRDYDREYD